jgi:hypothetical protein
LLGQKEFKRLNCEETKDLKERTRTQEFERSLKGEKEFKHEFLKMKKAIQSWKRLVKELKMGK